MELAAAHAGGTLFADGGFWGRDCLASMQLIGIALIGLGAGLEAGFVLAMRQRAAARGRHADDRAVLASAAALEARIDAQSAEIRRLADGARVRDLGEERMHAELRSARRALEKLAREALSEVTSAAATGVFVPRKAVTVEELRKDWLASLHHARATTLNAYVYASLRCASVMAMAPTA